MRDLWEATVMHTTAAPTVHRVGTTILKADRGEDCDYDEIRESPEGKLWDAIALSIYEPYQFALKVFARPFERRGSLLGSRHFMDPRYRRRKPSVSHTWVATGVLLKELQDAYLFAHSPAFEKVCEVLGYDLELRLNVLSRLSAKVRKLRDA